MENINWSYHPTCQLCPLHKQVLNVGIGGRGAEVPDILVVGDSPYAIDDEDNTSFSRRTQHGAQLQQIVDYLEENGLGIRLTNIVRCTAYEEKDGRKGTRKPKANEVKACAPWFMEERQLTKARVIVLCGVTVIKSVLNYNVPIDEIRGKPIWVEDVCYIPTYHPSNMVSYGSKADAKRALKPDVARQYILEDFTQAANIAYSLKAGEDVKVQEQIKYTIIKTKEEALDVLMRIKAEAIDLSVDIETNTYGNTPVDTIYKTGLRILSIGLCWKDNEAVVVPLDWDEAEFKPDELFRKHFIRALFDLRIPHIGQNYMYDLVALSRVYGIDPFRTWEDTLLWHHLLSPHQRHDLGTLAKLYTIYGGYEAEVKNLVAKLPVQSRGYHKVDWLAVARKNAHDVVVARQVRNCLKKEMSETLMNLYYREVLPSAHVCMEMSSNGILFDEEQRRVLELDLDYKTVEIKKLLRNCLCWKEAEEELGHVINTASTADVRYLLYDKLNLPVTSRTETGLASTNKETMKQLAKTNPIALGLLQLSTYRALCDKFIKVIPNWIGWDGRVHSEYKIHGTLTGRLASANPNAQNFPADETSAVMTLIKARPGYILIYFDVSQAELRMLSILTGEPAMVEAFQKGLDIHATVARDLFGISYEEALHDKVIRRRVKGLNFGVLYGMSEYGLSGHIKEPVDYCKDLISRYKSIYSRIDPLVQKVERDLVKTGKVTTILGRDWYNTNDLTNKAERREAVRQGFNCLIQSPTSGLVQMGLAETQTQRNKKFPIRDVLMFMQVHDSGIIEVKEGLEQEAGIMFLESMQTPSKVPFELTVPWKGELKIGYNLGMMYPYDPYTNTVSIEER